MIVDSLVREDHYRRGKQTKCRTLPMYFKAKKKKILKTARATTFRLPEASSGRQKMKRTAKWVE